MWASAGGSAAAGVASGTASPAPVWQDTATHTLARMGCCTVWECGVGPTWRGHTPHNGGLGREVAHRGEEVLDGHNVAEKGGLGVDRVVSRSCQQRRRVVGQKTPSRDHERGSNNRMISITKNGKNLAQCRVDSQKQRLSGSLHTRGHAKTYREIRCPTQRQKWVPNPLRNQSPARSECTAASEGKLPVGIATSRI
ncbi:hypothetical protein C8R44DRAFT_738793 [Mycena epipterygia]|nr:hypothetical protein C8R44DRAFT_738793 [Mycena epipterygia]